MISFTVICGTEKILDFSVIRLIFYANLYDGIVLYSQNSHKPISINWFEKFKKPINSKN